MVLFPLPFMCQHEHYAAQVDNDGDPVVDDYGNAVMEWATPIPRPCVWWYQESSAQYADESVSNEQASVDITLAIDSSAVVDQRDRFTVDGKTFEVVGLPKDYDHGPFGFAPNRRVVELKWVG